MGKPHFGITNDPDELKKREVDEKKTQEKNQIVDAIEEEGKTRKEETEKNEKPKFGISNSAPDPVRESQKKPSNLSKKEEKSTPVFGTSDSHNNRPKTNLLSVFRLQPWYFWLKAYVISFVGFIFVTNEVSGNYTGSLLYYIFWFNLILYPFASAMMQEIGGNIKLSTDAITYIIFGNSKILATKRESSGCLALAVMLALRFCVFLIEWSFSIIIGTIALIIMYSQLKK